MKVARDVLKETWIAPKTRGKSAKSGQARATEGEEKQTTRASIDWKEGSIINRSGGLHKEAVGNPAP